MYEDCCIRLWMKNVSARTLGVFCEPGSHLMPDHMRIVCQRGLGKVEQHSGSPATRIFFLQLDLITIRDSEQIASNEARGCAI